MHLNVRYKGKESFARLQGQLVAFLDHNDTQLQEILPFYATYYEDAMTLTTKTFMNYVTPRKHQYIIQLTQNTNSNLRIESMTL